MQDATLRAKENGPAGVVLLGGAHGTLALARSLGKRKVPVWLVSNDNPLPGWSRHIDRRLDWPGPDNADAVTCLLELARIHKLEGHLLVPGGDPEVRLVSQSIGALSSCYRIMLPAWDSLKYVCEKPLLYRRAAELKLDIPATYVFNSMKQAAGSDIRFPVVLKPNMGGGHDRFSRAKVVRADDKASFLAAYKDAAEHIGIDNVVVQELIMGGGESQFSYAALWHRGAPVAEFSARRVRQYPIEFGYTSTFVEVVEEPEVIDAGRRILESIGHEGLVEIEFKRDPRDGKLRVLDVNPRPWSWFGLADGAGVDLGAMLWEVANGRKTASVSARSKASWMYLVRDAVVAGKLMSSGRLSWREYLRSFARVRSWAAFSVHDPLPGLLDVPLTAWRVLTRRIFGFR
ncbi:carboxylate--amine ligase [Pseudaminobacter sp. NGMCC 1.201702]|uniref:carboxylate--amine ligase n=1 Tax=Pseudaminobacter sp. NGMCC 1.201702 TaxID=3391825 RepID=UPI0039F0E259